MLSWQALPWEAIRAMGQKLPHAFLFAGQPGIGKVAFARHLGASLLCERPDAAGHACGTCASCGWVEAGSHPDYILVRPEAIQWLESANQPGADDRDADDGAANENEETDRKPKRAPSKEIRIDQIRALTQALSVSSHRGGLRVVILYPAQAMNVFTANALLKILEEPPASTILLLVADSVERLLPTVVSRCQRLALAVPDAAEAMAWLSAHRVKDAARFLAEAGGAPLSALKIAQSPTEQLDLQAQLFARLEWPDRLDALNISETLGKCELPLVVGWIQRWIWDCLGYRLAQRIRYYPSHKERIMALAEGCEPKRLVAYARFLLTERRVADHPLSGRLFVENLLLAYADAIHGSSSTR